MMSRFTVSILLLAAHTMVGCTQPEGSGRTGSVDARADDGEKVGSVGALQLASNVRAGAVDVSVGASFTVGTIPRACRAKTIGDCQIAVCNADADGGTKPSAAPRRTDAGRITFSVAGKQLTLHPGSDEEYEAYVQETALWKSGDRIAMAADGDEVPAFSGELAAPDDVSVMMPAPQGAVPIVVSRSRDLQLAWTGGTVGQVTFTLVPGDPTLRASLACTFPSAAGHATIDAALLATLPAGPGEIAVNVISSTDLSRAGWTLTYSLIGSARSTTSAAGWPAPAVFE